EAAGGLRIENDGRFLRRHFAGAQAPHGPLGGVLSNGGRAIDFRVAASGGIPEVALHKRAFASDRRGTQRATAGFVRSRESARIREYALAGMRAEGCALRVGDTRIGREGSFLGQARLFDPILSVRLANVRRIKLKVA